MIQLEGVSRDYSTEHVRTSAVSNVNLDVPAGQYCAITGPSGCGKSTLLGIVGLMDQGYSGSYRLNGQEMASASPARLRRARNEDIGFVFQAFNLVPDISVLDNILLPCQFSSSGIVSKDRASAGELAERFGLSARLKHMPGQLSGGQQQRVAIARALIRNPVVVVADEPTGNLDSAATEVILGIFDEIHGGGTTLVVVTHDMQVASRAERRVSMRDGSVLAAAGNGG